MAHSAKNSANAMAVDYIGYQTESGTWSMEGDVEHIMADMINGDAAMSKADYKIDSADRH